MLIAVCLSGVSRSFKRTYDSFQNVLIKELSKFGDISLFISAWDWRLTTNERPNQDESGKHWYPMDGTAQEWVDLYKPLFYEIHLYNDKTLEGLFHYSEFCKKYHWVATSVLPMFYQVYKANLLKKEFERINNFKYDIVIRSRSDLVYSGEIIDSQIQQVIDGKGFGRISETNHLNDVFFMSNSQNADIYSDMFWRMDEYFKRQKAPVPEWALQAYLRDNGVRWSKSSLGIEILR